MKKYCVRGIVIFFLFLDQNIFAGSSENYAASDTQPYTGYPGYYLGFQLGVDSVNTNSVVHERTKFQATDKTGFAGRLYAGYKFTPVVAVELAYASLTDYAYHLSGQMLTNSGNILERQVYFFDLAGKFTLPLQRVFFYMAPGVAAVVTNYKYHDGGSRTFALPKLETGFGIHLTSAVSVGLAYAILLGRGGFNPVIAVEGNNRVLQLSTNSIPNIQMVTFMVNFAL